MSEDFRGVHVWFPELDLVAFGVVDPGESACTPLDLDLAVNLRPHVPELSNHFVEVGTLKFSITAWSGPEKK